MKRYFKIIIYFLLFILHFGFTACRVDNHQGVLMFIDDGPIYVEEFYQNLEKKKDLWYYYESALNQDFELKYNVLKELIIERLVLNYGEREAITMEEDHANDFLLRTIGEYEHLSNETRQDFIRTLLINYILRSAISEEMGMFTFKPDSLSGQSQESCRVFLLEFLFDSKECAQEFRGLFNEAEDLKIGKIIEEYNIFNADNPHSDLNILGYVPLNHATHLFAEDEEVLEHSFTTIIEGTAGFMFYYINDKREGRVMSEEELYYRNYLRFKVDKEREAKDRFIKEQFSYAEIRLLVEDDQINKILSRIKREFSL